MSFHRPAIALLFILILSGWGASRAEGQSCSRGRDGLTPFLGISSGAFDFPATSHVTVYVTPELRANAHLTETKVRDGLAKWDACQSTNSLHFDLNWTGTRPAVPPEDTTSQTYRTSVLIQYNSGNAPVDGTVAQPAEWSARSNVVTLYGLCPRSGTYGLPCAGPGKPIEWERSGWLETVIAHEIGHAAGLDHDRSSSGCAGGIMSETIYGGATNVRVMPYHCRLTELINDINAPCNGEAAGSNESHPCESEARRPGEGGPGGGDSGLAEIFCQEYPWCCSSGQPPWRGGGLSCDYLCIRMSDNLGGYSETCGFRCGPTPTSTGEDDRSSTNSSPTQGFGPWLHVRNPVDGAVVSGVIPITGWATHFFPARSVTFGIDGQSVGVQSYQYGFYDAEACTPPLGWWHAYCLRNAGFAAGLDTRNLSNGHHVLNVVATSKDGWPTSVDIPLIIDNPTCETTPPSISITAPAAGANLSGTVNVTATATDNVGVAEVQFFLDGTRKVTDATAPYAWSWNTSTSAAGAHTLQAKAFDGCGNVRASSLVSVQVVGAGLPEIAIARASSGVAVPDGGTTDIGTASVGSSISVRFRIDNVGSGDLAITNPNGFVSGACFSLLEVPAASIPAGGSTYFRVRFQCASPGTYTGAVTLLNNDTGESPYDITLTGTTTSS